MTGRRPYIGRAIERFEDLRFLQGKGQYVDDLKLPGMLHAAIFRSAVAHGKIVSIDSAVARALPGVHAVLTAADIVSDLGAPIPMIPMRLDPHPSLVRFIQPVIAYAKVRYVGEPVAVVIADTAAIAEDALALLEVDIDPLPVVVGRKASEAGEVLLFEEHGTNCAMVLTGTRGDADAAIRGAHYVRREKLSVHRHAALPMETRGVVAEWDAKRGKLTLYGASKVPFATRAVLAQQMKLPESSVEAVENDVGGGFGVRGVFYPEDFLIPFAARKLGRPVKWIEDRREHLMATSQSREVECELEIACSRDGDILALRGQAWSHTGAYVRPNGVTAPRNLAQMIAGPYRIPHFRMEVSMLLSNKTPMASYRGPGRFEADFFRERMMDLAAADLGIDRVEFRRRNLIAKEEMPYEFPVVQPYGTKGATDSGDYQETLDRCLVEIGWAEKSKLQGRLVDGWWHGLGVGCYIEGGAMGPKEIARLVLKMDGSIAVYVGSSALGQGVETIFAQIAADALGVSLERISGVFHGSTSYVSQGWGTGGSRSTVMGGSAVLDAAKNLKLLIRKTAAEQFGCEPDAVEISDDLSAVSADGKLRTLSELAVEELSVEGTFVNSRRTYSYGAHAAHVAVNARTGALRVIDYVGVEDVGRAINPMTVHAQAMGAIVQGLGGSILERLVYDEHGQLLTGSLAAYTVPLAEDFPSVRSITLEHYPSPLNPLGAKGAGEGGIIPVGGVIANAVASALASLGVQPFDLPLSPPKIWEMIEAAKARN